MYRAGIVSLLNHLNLTSVKDSIKSQNASVGSLPTNSKQGLASSIRTRLGDQVKDMGTEFDDEGSSISELKSKASPNSAIHRSLKTGKINKQRDRRLSIKSDGFINGL